MKQHEPSPEGEPHLESVTGLERRVLGALCQGTREGSVKEWARSLLAGYQWREGANAAVFDIVMSFPASSTDLLREQLAARLTRRGFPDFDVAGLFGSPQPTYDEVGAWMRRLRELAEEKR